MICAEDEIGIGTSHDGIIVLPTDAVVGTPAKEYYNVKDDYVLEVDITPNRADATSHFGVARDLAAYLAVNGLKGTLVKPSVDAFAVENHNLPVSVTVENSEACPRYAGVSISGVTIKESPEWLQNDLKSIGLRPINNVVDITNFILHETGQPLHSFDADKIAGKQVIVKTLPEGTKFTTLDEAERSLSDKDLMICDANGGMKLLVPTYRVDVQRDVDVIEDILRIYGYNNVLPGESVKSSISYSSKPDSHKLQNLISEQLTGCGFNEILNNSLTKAGYYETLSSFPAANLVMMMNPLSADLNAMFVSYKYIYACNNNGKNGSYRIRITEKKFNRLFRID